MPTLLLILLLISGYLFYLWWFRHTWDAGAPYEGIGGKEVERAFKMAGLKKGDKFYELGSGDGRVVIAAALVGADAIGIEIDKLRAWYSKLWVKILRLKNAKIVRGDIFKANIKDADVVYTYLLPETNEKLKRKLKKELKKGTRIIAMGFRFKGWKPEKTDPRGPVYGPIYIYKT